MSMAMALNNVKKCYSKVPNRCPVSIGGTLGLDTMGSKSFSNINFTKLFSLILDFIEVNCIVFCLEFLPQKRWHQPS